MSSMEINDDRLPGQRAFDRMLRDFELPPLHVLPAIEIDDHGEVYGAPAWEELT